MGAKVECNDVKLNVGDTIRFNERIIFRVESILPEPIPEQERCYGCGHKLGSAVYRRWSEATQKAERVCLMCKHDIGTMILSPIDILKRGIEIGEARAEERHQQGLQDGQERPVERI